MTGRTAMTGLDAPRGVRVYDLSDFVWTNQYILCEWVCRASGPYSVWGNERLR